VLPKVQHYSNQGMLLELRDCSQRFAPLAMGDTEAKHPKPEARFISKVVNIFFEVSVKA
jgi:hypothetical protein